MNGCLVGLALVISAHVLLADENVIPFGDMEAFRNLAQPLPVWNRMGEPARADEWEVSREAAASGEVCISTTSDREFVLGGECPGGSLTGRAMVRAAQRGTSVILRVSWYDRLSRRDATETFEVGTEWQAVELTAPNAISGPCELAVRAEAPGARIWVDEVALLAGSGPANPMAEEAAIQVEHADLLAIQAYDGQARPQSGAVPLHLDIPQPGRAALPVVSGGVPFPKGELFSPDEVRVMSGGREVPCQADVLARWHGDSSIQALLVSLDLGSLARSGGEVPDLVLEYGPDVRRQPVESRLTVEKVEDGYTISTRAMAFRLADDVPGPVDLGVSGRPAAARSAPVLLGLDGADIAGQTDGRCTVAVERRGPLLATFVVRAQHETHAGSPALATDMRITVFDGAPTRLLVEQSLTNVSRRPAEVLRAAGFRFQLSETFAASEGAVSWSRDGDLGSTIRSGAATRDATERTALGWLTAALGSTRLSVSVRDFAEQHPMALDLSGHEATVWMWPPDSGCAVSLSQGISQTREFAIDFAQGLPPLHTRTRPLLLAEPEWVCASGVFGSLLPPDPETFPIFETRIGNLQTLGRFSWEAKDSGRLYGAFNYGDAPGDGGWSNLETMAAHELFLHHFRTLSREHYEAACLAAEHYRDVDIHHGLGFCHTHCSNHTTGGEGWSHSWVQGIRDLFFLTGDGRSLDVLEEIGTRLLSKEPGFTTGRDWTRPIDNLVDIYAATGDDRYLRAALANVRVLRERQEPEYSICGAEKGSWYEDRYCAGSAFTWYGCLAMANLHRNVGGDELRDTFLRELDLSLDVATKGKRSYNFFPDETVSELKRAEEIGIFALGRGSVVFPPLGYAYRITSDRKYLELGMRVLAFCLMNQRGGSDASATSFMTAFLREAMQAGIGPKEEAAAFQAARDFAWEQWPRTLVNGDLELGSFRNWDIKKVPGQGFFYDGLVKVGLYLDDEVVHRGRYALRFHSDNYSRHMSASCAAALEPGRRWRASIWVRSPEDMDPAASVQVREYDTDESRGAVLRPTGRTEDGWEERAATIATAERAVARLVLSHSNGTDDCWFDTASVEDLGPTYALLTKAVGGAYRGAPKVGGGDSTLEEPIPFEKGSLTDGVSDYVYQNVPQATYSYWQEPEAELIFTLREPCRVRRVTFHMLQHGKPRSHGTARAELLDPETGNVIATVEPPADGWNEIGDLNLETDTVRIRFTRREGYSYITLSEFDIWGERL